MQTRTVADSTRMMRMTTAELRANYLVENLFQPGTVQLIYTDVDRAIVGGIVPTTQKLALEASKELAATDFAERREIGILNLGSKGTVTADGKELWVSGRYDGVVYVFDTGTGQVTHRIAVGREPHGLCVWPQPGRYSLGHTGNMR